ncbi:SGNH/GDSL hydrolase family protein [Planosporangium sp. 12N6]|uniref:SGNH/GDSL hydrolase family protein n=1 Tax=Planosporangium spinosum TaxID=3402278 RepID=UPI003CF7D976
MSFLRRLGQAAAVTAIAGTVGGAAVLAGQAMLARSRRYAQPDLRLAMRASIGDTSAAPLRLVLLGDSTALGVGVEQVTDTVGGQLAMLLAEEADGRRVELSSVAVSGSRSADLGTQVARALVGTRPDVAVILVGGNDAVHFTAPAEAADDLASAVRRLRAAGVAVVVGTCPDLGSARAFPPPLRQLVGWHGRRLARAQAAAVATVGGVPVDLAAQTGAVFRADAGTYCHDGYHPSADGYRVWAHALLPAVTEASGVPQ